MSTLLVTGASGYLGQAIVARARNWTIVPTAYSRPVLGYPNAAHIDLRDADAVDELVRAASPDVIIHTAASNRNAEHIAAIVPAAVAVAAAARQHGVRLIHVSTDLVFDGDHAPYADDSPPSPLDNPYALAKATAEQRVADQHPGAAIVRPSLIWGLEPLDHQTQWLVDGAKSGAPVTLFTDEVRCPVYVGDLADWLLELAARHDLVGPFNAVGAQPLTRWDLGQKLLRKLGIRPGPNVKAALSKELAPNRARNLTLTATRAADLLRTRLRGVDDVLATM
ncbi:MAG TPA: sugar nucleotide-binding protein [Anaerolineales bacterium]|nr:sugar nucleotide-binding protein [Anaerolineales bacterium]